jgi:hypothetical protein
MALGHCGPRGDDEDPVGRFDQLGQDHVYAGGRTALDEDEKSFVLRVKRVKLSQHPFATHGNSTLDAHLAHVGLQIPPFQSLGGPHRMPSLLRDRAGDLGHQNHQAGFGGPLHPNQGTRAQRRQYIQGCNAGFDRFGGPDCADRSFGSNGSDGANRTGPRSVERKRRRIYLEPQPLPGHHRLDAFAA